MSVFNEMQAGGYNEVLTRRFALQGAAASPALVPEVGAGLVIENDRPEWGYLMGENAFHAQVAVGAGGAGFNSTAALLLPASATTTILCVRRILGIGTGNLSARLVRRGVVGPSLSFVRYGEARDGRFAGQSTAALYTQNTAAVVVTAGGLYPPAVLVDTPFTMRSGDTLVLWNSQANTAFSFCFEWTERQAAPGELV